MAKGIIYVCSTAVNGLIKIGKTIDFESRMTFLESNGYRNVVGLKREFAIEVENYNEIEMLLDDLFAKSKVGNTELFSLDLNKVIQLLSAFQGKQIYPKEETKEEVFERVTEAVQSGLLPDGEYYLNIKPRIGERVTATMEVNSGTLILKKGSIISDVVDNVLNNGFKRISLSLNTQNNVLQEDTIMSSVSCAAAVVMGKNYNGWTAWKDKNGKLIDIYRVLTNNEE